MRNWIKLILIAVGVTLGILIINELTYQGPSMGNQKKKAVSPIGREDFTPKTSVELPSFDDRRPPETPKKSLPPIFSSGNKKEKKEKTPSQPWRVGANQDNPNKPRTNSGGGGGSGGGNNGGSSGGNNAGSSTGTGTASLPTNPGETASNGGSSQYWLEESDDPTYNLTRHNLTCTRYKNIAGRGCNPDEGNKCPDCGG